MQAAILVFGIIAAVASVVAPLWRQRDRLELTFREGFSGSGTQISLPCRVESLGRSSIFNIDLVVGPPGITLDHQSTR